MTCHRQLHMKYSYTQMAFHQSDINDIEILLNKNFSLICDWFVDNKLRHPFW